MTKETNDLFNKTLNEALTSFREEDDEKKKEIKLKELKELNEIINAADAAELDQIDKLEKRRIDEAKNAEMAEIEKKKVRQGWIKIGVEAIVAIGLTILGIAADRSDLKDVTEFEETGRYNSQSFQMWKNNRGKRRKK